MSALQSMQIPPQEDWSLELLHELQRAVPVLESSSFNLDDDIEVNNTTQAVTSVSAGGSDAGSGASDTQFTSGWGGWECGDESGTDKNSADLLSDDAMALPMSTLTSGKRKTYANRSTFQAHVCCVMHPSQVPHVLQSLQASPHFQSVSHWPYAYRIISPFDGQTHEGSDDGEDAGAGEKMLALLQRMGLENLLLIVSRWDTGPPDRLGLELFKCINQQCKELLRELQQAVRASFPPEELLRADFVQNAEADATGCEEHIKADFSQMDDTDAPITDADYVMLEAETAAKARQPEQEDTEPNSPRLFDFRALGSTPQIELWHKVFYGYPVKFRSSQAADQWEEIQPGAESQSVQDALDVAASCGLQVSAAPMHTRLTPERQGRAGKARGMRGTAASHGAAEAEEVTLAEEPASPRSAASAGKKDRRHSSRETHSKAHYESSGTLSTDERGSESSADFGVCEDEARMEWMSRMTSEELLRYGAELRMDRHGLEERLGDLGHAAEVIRNLNVPFFEGIADVEPPEDKRLQASAAPKYNKRPSRMIKQDILAFSKTRHSIAQPGLANKGNRSGNSLKSAGLSLLGII